ncbi:hypothetical protein N0V82_007030 [Gnomoniopsis sp. IMI 355080]|nr:hypothetical protein N0V82_007030 [Gnomoniopsis sp. IMI 355080]
MVTTRSVSRSTSSTPLPTASSAVGSALEIDPVSKARTIAHMNKDHTEDMSAILRHYMGLTPQQAADAEMQDLDLATMVIRAVSGVHAVPVTPPMSSWNDRRGRLVEMTVEARKALGLDVADESDHVSGRNAGVQFFPPEGTGIVSFAGVLWYFLSAAFVFSGNVQPGSAFWRFVEAIHFPGGPEMYVWLVKMILLPMLAIHVGEAAYMAKSRLEPKEVPVGSLVWFLWVGCAFFEGVPCWQKWDRRVLGKQKVQ